MIPLTPCSTTTTQANQTSDASDQISTNFIAEETKRLVIPAMEIKRAKTLD